MGWYEERFTDLHGRKKCKCSECQKEYWLPASKASLYLTCGGDCAAKRRERRISGRRRNCVTCGMPFIPRSTQVSAGHGVYCSQKCNVAGRAAMMQPDAQHRARAKWRAKHAISGIVKSGPSNPRWSGGRNATYQRQMEKGALREQNHKRRLRGGAPIPRGTAHRVGKLQRWKCAICGVGIQKKYHLDHVTPLALGGTNAGNNFQLLCPPCNRMKGAKHPVDFMRSLGFLL